MSDLTHLDESGAARMVDVGDKPATRRVAVAEAVVVMSPELLEKVFSGGMPKGDVIAVARVAGIQAAKKTSDLIPLCHPIPIDSVSVDLTPDGHQIRITATVTTTGTTGVEMEALTAASVAALTVYDMVKSVERGVTIESVGLVSKSGGRSGEWSRVVGGQESP
ncbi:MAG TPA: cyclic pyranopterin monophosphate synthase MoaC [Acidimicrobiia bacterium]|jgi:cyclic pyranopterin phosphate synthase|nr:cyclic pyranopterin monophosphate synthase MoaC [Acidimicrobiia bacterium]